MNPIVTDTDKIISVPAFSVHNMLEMVNRVNFWDTYALSPMMSHGGTSHLRVVVLGVIWDHTCMKLNNSSYGCQKPMGIEFPPTVFWISPKLFTWVLPWFDPMTANNHDQSLTRTILPKHY